MGQEDACVIPSNLSVALCDLDLLPLDHFMPHRQVVPILIKISSFVLQNTMFTS